MNIIKKILFYVFALMLSFSANAITPVGDLTTNPTNFVSVRPDLWPILNTPSNANCEFYTQYGGGQGYRVPYGILQKTIAPLAIPNVQLNYIPAQSGNPTNDRGRIVRGANNLPYYIDWEGRAIQLGTAGANYTAGLGILISGNSIINNGDLSNNNEIQTLSRPSVGTLKLTNGAALPTYVYLPDSSTTNEIQTLSLAVDTIKLSKGGGFVKLPTGTVYSAGTGISISGSTISNTGDLSNTNEIQTLGLSGNTLSLSNGGGSVTLPTAPFSAINGAGDITASTSGGVVTVGYVDGDKSSTNEIQTLSISGQNVSLSNGGGSVTIPYTDWANVTNKPATFTPASHTHPISNVTNLQDSLNVKSRIGHGHTIAQIANLQDSLNSRKQTLSFNVGNGNLSISNGNTVNIPVPNSIDVSGGLINLNYSGGLQVNTTTSSVVQSGLPTGTTNQVLTYNGSAWVAQNSSSGADNWGSQVVQRTTDLTGNGTSGSPLGLATTGVSAGTYNNVTVNTTGRVTSASNVSYAAASHTHTIANITNLQDSLLIKTQKLSKTGNTISLSNGGGSITDNDFQNLSISGNTLSITGGNSVTLPSGITYSAGNGIDLTNNIITATDASTTNELQTISKSGSTITLSNGGGSVTDSDAQTLSISGNTINISGGNGVNVLNALPAASSGQVLTHNGSTWVAGNGSSLTAGTGIDITGNTVSLANTGTAGTYNVVNVNAKGQVTSGAFNSYITSEVDGSTTNELQTISKSGSTISLSNGGGSVTDSDAQTLSLSGNSLSISGGNSVTLPSSGGGAIVSNCVSFMRESYSTPRYQYASFFLPAGTYTVQNVVTGVASYSTSAGTNTTINWAGGAFFIDATVTTGINIAQSYCITLIKQ